MQTNTQLRSHLDTGIVQRVRSSLHARNIGVVGKNLYVEKNVEIMRYPKNVSVGNDVIIKEGCRICSCNPTATISIGDRTTVGYHTFMFASNKITIGSDCLISPFVYIVDSDHGIALGSNINTQPNVTAPITICDDVWIGCGAKILKGVVIGKGAVVASGAVVKYNVGEYEIVGGVPARVLGERV